MINKDRIIPITKIDLLSLVGMVLTIAAVDYEVLKASDVAGNFVLAEAGTVLADQPVKSLDFTAASGKVYFVPDYSYTGITANGAAVTIAEGSAEVDPNSSNLYVAELASGSVTISAVTPIA